MSFWTLAGFTFTETYSLLPTLVARAFFPSEIEVMETFSSTFSKLVRKLQEEKSMPAVSAAAQNMFFNLMLYSYRVLTYFCVT